MDSTQSTSDFDPANSLRIAVLISGGGTTLRNLLARQGTSELPATIACVVSSNPNARGNELATESGIPLHVVRRKDHETAEEFREAVFSPCRSASVDLVVMGGFLKHVLIPGDFENRVINIHPSLLPKYGGKGFYGSRVHQAVIDHGETESGCTVHFVDDLFDHGPVILQRRVDVLPDDTAETLAARVFTEECLALPQAIRQLKHQALESSGD